MSDAFRTHDGRTLQQAASELVSREVHLCLSSMISTMAVAAHMDSGRPGSSEYTVVELGQQALELSAPVLDYEEAAREAGWTHGGPGTLWTIADGRDDGFTAATAEEACDLDSLDPHEWEVYEHWAVSTWLAEKLEAAGERVDTDFAGLNVWARTTTGQAISMDAVFERIVRELHAPSADAAN